MLNKVQVKGIGKSGSIVGLTVEQLRNGRRKLGVTGEVPWVGRKTSDQRLSGWGLKVGSLAWC